MQSFKKHINQDGVASPATRGDVSAGPHSAVPMPRWTLALRILQFIFAILVLGLTAYAEHIYDHEYLQPAYIPALLAAILTILVFIPLTTSLLAIQRHLYHPGVAFAADLVATLFWLAVMAVLASYSAIYQPRFLTDLFYSSYSYYDSNDEQLELRRSMMVRRQYDEGFNTLISTYKRGWACGAAASAFAGVEFLLFLLSTLIFLHVYHNHRLASAAPPTYAPDGGHVASTGRGPAPTSPYATTSRVDSQHDGDQFEMHQYQQQYSGQFDGEAGAHGIPNGGAPIVSVPGKGGVDKGGVARKDIA